MAAASVCIIFPPFFTPFKKLRVEKSILWWWSPKRVYKIQVAPGTLRSWQEWKTEFHNHAVIFTYCWFYSQFKKRNFVTGFSVFHNSDTFNQNRTKQQTFRCVMTFHFPTFLTETSYVILVRFICPYRPPLTWYITHRHMTPGCIPTVMDISIVYVW